MDILSVAVCCLYKLNLKTLLLKLKVFDKLFAFEFLHPSQHTMYIRSGVHVTYKVSRIEQCTMTVMSAATI